MNIREVSIEEIWLRGSTHPTMVQTAKGEDPLQMDIKQSDRKVPATM